MELRRSILCFLLVLCVFYVKTSADDNQVPLTKLGAKTGPTLKFFYCYSCGYRKAFEEYAGILQQKYPELQIDGENFYPPGHNMFLAKLLGTLKIVVILLIISGVNVYQWFGMEQPSFWQWCTYNRFYACILVFFFSNAIEGHFISSGAFEIHFNDVPVWSKLETGRIPQPPELFQIIDNHLKMLYSDIDTGKMSYSK